MNTALTVYFGVGSAFFIFLMWAAVKQGREPFVVGLFVAVASFFAWPLVLLTWLVI